MRVIRIKDWQILAHEWFSWLYLLDLVRQSLVWSGSGSVFGSGSGSVSRDTLTQCPSLYYLSSQALTLAYIYLPPLTLSIPLVMTRPYFRKMHFITSPVVSTRHPAADTVSACRRSTADTKPGIRVLVIIIGKGLEPCRSPSGSCRIYHWH